MDEPHRIAAIRGFNRFYTQTIGALGDRWLGSTHSLAELRILYELSLHSDITATALAQSLGMDAGFLSRKLVGLARKRLVKRTRSSTDKRQLHLSLTALARKQQPKLQEAATAQVRAMLAAIAPEKQGALVAAMERIQAILSGAPAAPIVFRQLRHGDAGWIIHRHGALIAREFGWDMEFEALCAQIMADFIRNYQPDYERSWIVEREGDILGSLFLIRADAMTAKLRLLYVEPAARGLGLDTKLLEKSFAFARSKGYRRITLFTTSGNVNARRIYVKLGMTLTKEEPLDFAGAALMGETWEMAL
jgi:DNA-binding MarR family transcriptional regulator